MDAMTSFEARLARELDAMAGPGRGADPMTVAQTAAATTPAWRIRPLTALAAAGVAALLIAIVAVGALRVFDRTASEPLVGSGNATDLLPGVDLQTEAVAPGIHRVLGDGERRLLRDDLGVVATGDGGVLVERGRIVRYAVFDAGTRNEAVVPMFERLRTIELGRPGTIERDIRPFRGLIPTGEDEYLVCHDTTDGVCWRRGFGDGNASNVERVDRSGSVTTFPGRDIGFRQRHLAAADIAYLRVATDDVVWVRNGDDAWPDMASYDGTTWTIAPPVEGADPDGLVVFDVDAAGTVWRIDEIEDPTRASRIDRRARDGHDIRILLSRWDGRRAGPRSARSTWSTPGSTSSRPTGSGSAR